MLALLAGKEKETAAEPKADHFFEACFSGKGGSSIRLVLFPIARTCYAYEVVFIPRCTSRATVSKDAVTVPSVALVVLEHLAEWRGSTEIVSGIHQIIFGTTLFRDRLVST